MSMQIVQILLEVVLVHVKQDFQEMDFHVLVLQQIFIFILFLIF